jgi:hypothetical protein
MTESPGSINTDCMKKSPVYEVSRLKKPMKINGIWNKYQWQKIPAVEIDNTMGDKPKFIPGVQAKMMYDNNNLYVIFLVNDRFVRCLVRDFNGPVYEEPCVEFFFSPDTMYPERYFNLEINCGGTPLMHYNDHSRKVRKELSVNDMQMIEIVHSLPNVVDPEITEPVTWTIEYRLPLSILEKYSKITPPGKGISWKANFYKIAEKGSNVHFLTWSVVDNPEPNFHLPQFFGNINFL